jgi:sugar phosphate isomerase/epimerase
MARLSINEMTTYRWSFEEDMTELRAAAIPAVGVWRQKVADLGEDRAVELLAQSGLAVSNLLWAGGFTGSDGHTYAESVQDATDAIRLAARLKAGCLVVYSGGRNSHTHNHARRLFASALAELLPLAMELDVTLAVEPMHSACASDWTFLTTLDETVLLLEALDHPRLKLAFDTYHLGHDPAVLDEIARVARHVAIVHLGDSQKPPSSEQSRQRLGAGILPLRQIVGALQQAGYDGDYDVELIGEEIERTCYRELLRDCRRAFAELLPSA